MKSKREKKYSKKSDNADNQTFNFSFFLDILPSGKASFYFYGPAFSLKPCLFKRRPIL